jgi:hypothetical protein
MPTVNEAIARGCCGQVDRLRSRDKLIPASFTRHDDQIVLPGVASIAPSTVRWARLGQIVGGRSSARYRSVKPYRYTSVNRSIHRLPWPRKKLRYIRLPVQGKHEPRRHHGTIVAKRRPKSA